MTTTIPRQRMTPTQNHAEYLRVMLELLRQANSKAQKASRKWNRLNDQWNDWYRRQFPDNYDADGDVIDIKHYTDTKTPNLRMAAAFDEWSFWERESKRLATTLIAEEATAKMIAALEAL